jgi:hypothetical protein
MTGMWNVQLEDGQHWIKADLTAWTGRLKVYFDNQQINSSFILLMIGNVYSFQRNGHYFVISIKGLSYLGGRFVLYIDGNEVPEGGMLAPAPPPPPSMPQRQPLSSSAQLIQEVNVVETTEVYRVEEYPFDNTFGDSPISTERQFSEESTNEISLDENRQTSGKIGLDAFSWLKAEVAREVSRRVGHNVGEKVTESQTLTFAVGAKSSVVYRIIWKRNIRTGEYIYLINGSPVTIPYRMKYGLSVEVKTRQHSTAGGAVPFQP